MHALLNVAIMAAHAGGDTLIRSLNKLEKLKIERKAHNDFVSDADRIAEQAVIDTIKKHYPDHAILAEESGRQGDSDYVWVIDPLDGTTNFLHRFPVFCVSVRSLSRAVSSMLPSTILCARSYLAHLVARAPNWMAIEFA